MLREQYLHEKLWRLERRRQRVLKPPEPAPRRGALRATARLVGRALVAAGARLLAYSDPQARAYLAPYSPRLDQSRN